MKKLVILILILSLTACTKNSTKVSLSQLPDDYDLDAAKKDNCVVFEDSDITHGQSVWDDFISVTEDNKSATVRLGFYYTLGDSSHYSKEYYEEIKNDYPVIYIEDLNFDGEKYSIESFEDGRLISKEYKYLVKYEGKPRSSSASFSEYIYYVLVNDNTVTWEDIEYGMLSSQYGKWIDHYVVYSNLKFK